MDAQRVVRWWAGRGRCPAVRKGVFGVRIVLLLASASLLSGCIFGTLDADLKRTQHAVDAIETRVTRLERARMTGSVPPPAPVEGAGGAAFPSGLEEPVPIDSAAAPVEGAATGGRFPQVPLPSWAAFGKLLRGMVNLVTGWVEVPKRVYETSRTSGAGSGFTFGFVRGLGYGFIRTVGGAYEMATFLFPAPPDYRPVMRPEYVFVCETDEPHGP